MTRLTDSQLIEHARTAAPEPAERGADIARTREWLAGENRSREAAAAKVVPRLRRNRGGAAGGDRTAAAREAGDFARIYPDAYMVACDDARLHI